MAGPQCGGEKPTVDGRTRRRTEEVEGVKMGDKGFHTAGSGHGNVSLELRERFGRDRELQMDDGC